MYLSISDDDVRLNEADPLWGSTVEEATQSLWSKHGMPSGVLAIGQAGENLVPFSMAFIDRISTLGRGGFGAVMGSKNLKAVVVKGTGRCDGGSPQAVQGLNQWIAGQDPIMAAPG